MGKLRHGALKYLVPGSCGGALGLASMEPLTCAHGECSRTSLLSLLLLEPWKHQGLFMSVQGEKKK